MRNFNNDLKMDIPLFAKLFIGFIILFALIIWGSILFLIFSAITNPAAIGEFFGQIVAGFNQTAGT